MPIGLLKELVDTHRDTVLSLGADEADLFMGILQKVRFMKRL